MKRLSALLPLLFVLSSLPLAASAAPSFKVTPVVIDTKAVPRDILDFTLTVENTGNQPMTLYPSVNNISVDDGGKLEKFIPAAHSDRTASLAAWIEIPRHGIDMARGASVDIPLTIRVNPNAVPGEYHAFIGFGFGRNRDEAERMVAIGRAPGSVVTVTIEGEHNEFLKLSRFIIDRFITSGTNEAAVYKIKNPGDEPLVPTGEIIIYNNRGAEINSLTVNPGHESIPPGVEKEFTADVPIKGLFGKYKAYLSVEYGSQLASFQDTAFFYVFPMKIILSILGVLCVVAVVVALLVHKRYLDKDTIDDSEQISVHVRDSNSNAMEHDINLKQP